MNAVDRQRRTNARRIAEVGVAPAAPAAAPAVAAERWPEPGPDLPHPLPLAAQDRADALSGTPVVIDLLADPDGPRAVVALAGQPVHGHVVLSDDSTAVYTSAPGYTGADVFGYRLTDARGRVRRVTVTVSVCVAPSAEPASAEAVLAYAA
jgi:Bacterial Ig domain